MSPFSRRTSLHDVYDSCAPAAFRRARALLGSDADAWDVVQQVFSKLAEGDLLARVSARPMTYVYRATTNACLNELEKQRIRSASGHRLLAPVVASPGDRVHARDLLEKLAGKLDEVDRQILVLAFQDGMSQDEIAEVLGVWRRTVGRRFSRLRALVDELGREPAQRIS